MELILASASPRRRELLKKAGLKFSVIESGYEEKPFSSDPFLTAKTFAFGKANDVFLSLKDKEDKVVLGADTVVYACGKILGKPKDAAQAEETLKLLSGRVHSVITGYSIISLLGAKTGAVESKVKFNNLTDEIIKRYIDSGLYKGKAGGYGIQDGFPLVESYSGSLDNVIGLPTETVAPLLKEYFFKERK